MFNQKKMVNLKRKTFFLFLYSLNFSNLTLQKKTTMKNYHFFKIEHIVFPGIVTFVLEGEVFHLEWEIRDYCAH